MYAPTADKDETGTEHFYKQLGVVLRSIKTEDITIVMGDFNAKIGRGKVDGFDT